MSETYFEFQSKFSRLLLRILVDENINKQDIRDKLGWKTSKLSAYLNDVLILSNNDAIALSDYIKTLGYGYPDDNLQLLQKEALFVEINDEHIAERDEKMVSVFRLKPKIKMATLTITHDNC